VLDQWRRFDGYAQAGVAVAREDDQNYSLSLVEHTKLFDRQPGLIPMIPTAPDVGFA
jgi:hypothetical protein